MHQGVPQERRPGRSDSTLQSRGRDGLGEVVPDAMERAMSSYTPYHPRWIRPRMSTYWWMQRGSYLKFILRELSSIFVAWFVVYLLLLLRALSHGTMAYHQFLDR